MKTRARTQAPRSRLVVLPFLVLPLEIACAHAPPSVPIEPVSLDTFPVVAKPEQPCAMKVEEFQQTTAQGPAGETRYQGAGKSAGVSVKNTLEKFWVCSEAPSAGRADFVLSGEVTNIKFESHSHGGARALGFFGGLFLASGLIAGPAVGGIVDWTIGGIMMGTMIPMGILFAGLSAIPPSLYKYDLTMSASLWDPTTKELIWRGDAIGRYEVRSRDWQEKQYTEEAMKKAVESLSGQISQKMAEVQSRKKAQADAELRQRQQVVVVETAPTAAIPEPAPTAKAEEAPPAKEAAAEPEQSVESKLRQLKKMYEDGLINKKEYDKKRKDLLKQL